MEIEGSDTSGVDPSTLWLSLFQCRRIFQRYHGLGGHWRCSQKSRGSNSLPFLANVGIRDALTAEIMAIAKAIELCITKSDICKKDVTFISDSGEVVSWVNGGGCGNSDHMLSMSDVRSNLLKMDGAHIIFKSRDSNSVADSLAKRGSGGGDDRESWSIV
ncbi:hypothetical protein Dsin_001831 [Dipteronia sinensis]|uniref:RNase H type-1 domain-containing protein n=1 Tax=Dipteronia sinensis TaxID=43782 RepID=A0AAE0B600_9ROSI|nr:hypothetical protein Dsin_001831 [Dipteronia sinensis]